MNRAWILWLLLVAFLWVVISRITEIQKVVETLAAGRWEWVLAAALLEALFFVLYAALYQSAFHTVEVKSRLRDLLPVAFAAVFVNVAAPTVGASGAALFVDDAARRGESPARAAAGTLLFQVADLGTFTLILLAGLAYLFRHHTLRTYQIVAATILLFIIGGLTAILLMGLWRLGVLRALFASVRGVVNAVGARLGRPAVLSRDWAERNAGEFADAATALTKHPDRLYRTLGVALCAHAANLVCLCALFHAFGQPAAFGILVTGYAMAILFWTVAVVPQGIGVVEGVMALSFTSVGVPAEKATVIAVGFRGLSFWLPLAVGSILTRRLPSFRGRKVTASHGRRRSSV